MKYTTEVQINLPRQRVIELFDNSENLFKWQQGLKDFQHLEGEPGTEGARSRMVYEGRKGDLEMMETIRSRNLPDEIHMVYHARGVYHAMANYFIQADEGTTIWRTVSDFRFRGLMVFMSPFMKQAFMSNTLLSMERFRVFAEKNSEK